MLEGDTVIIQGNCDTKQIHSFMNNQGAQAKEVHFANTIVIQTLQTWEQIEADDFSALPFAGLNKLEKVSADSNSKVLFAGADSSAHPTLLYFFGACPNLKSIEGLATWNVSNVTGECSMMYLFVDCSSLTSLEGLSTWDVSHLTGESCLEYAFQGCSALTSLDALSTWDVSQVTGDACMHEMFEDCKGLLSLDGLSAWDISRVAGDQCMRSMFSGCSALTSLDALSAWNVSNVTGGRCMSQMFNDCTSLTSLDGLASWQFSTNPTKEISLWGMFWGCNNLVSLEGISMWNVSRVTKMDSMFQDCASLVSLDALANWDVSNVEGSNCMASMFKGCTSLVSIDALSTWNIAKALNPQTSPYGVSEMFAKGVSGLDMNISSITVSSTFTLTEDMFKNSTGTLPSWYWWPVDNASATSAYDMGNFIAETQNASPVSLRWQRCNSISDNPMQSVASITVDWSTAPSNLVYTGLIQTIRPASVSATVQGQSNPVVLTEGQDYYLSYVVAGKSYSAMQNVGSYNAHVTLRGKWLYSATSNPQPITISALDITQATYDPFIYTPYKEMGYTGSELTPKTMVRLHLQDVVVQNKTIPAYSYLIEKTATQALGDYRVSYANNTAVGTATATVTGINPNLVSSSQTTTFEIIGEVSEIIIDTGDGSFGDGTHEKVIEKKVGDDLEEKDLGTPTRDGYDFGGWADANGNKIVFPYRITSTELSFYAIWIPKQTDVITIIFVAGEGNWNGITETTREGASDAAIIAPVYPTVDATRTCIGWFDEASKEVVSGVTKFSEVTGVVTARFVDTPGWHQNATGWWYVYDLSNNYYTNCWAFINSAWFYFNDAGYCLEYTWGYIGGEWYFFGWGGYMQTGWQWLGGSWYFLDRNSGAMQTGWVHDGVWYYCDAALGGAMYDNCWAYINGNWYGFNEGGSMTQGWSWSYAYDGWFYLQPDTGHMLYGWQYIGGHWYYFYDNGLMAANTYVGTYWLGSDGAMW